MVEYTKEQETIVRKVLSYKSHQYYEILSVEKTATEGDIKKSYRKLAIKLHPDKNPHPRSSEAFKLLNKAWGVLSDPSKKSIYDQTGVDPDSRGAAAASGFSGGSRAGSSPFAGGNFGGMHRGGPEDDLFNMFFGGGQGQTFSFGGNGFTFQNFGGGDHPFFQTNMHQRRAQPRARQGRTQQAEEEGMSSLLGQILPLLLMLCIPILSAVFSNGNARPEYSFVSTKEFTTPRYTPNHNIPFYVSNDFTKKQKRSASELRNFDSKVENVYIQERRSKCSKEQIMKNELIEEAQGWFYTDQEKLDRAQNMPMPNCRALRKMNLI
ncbi:hypothetical protein CAAN1_18S00716 [[Candida] anglica]|uniref:J domain-containing protein n=1 Tax=[Candida] anglica TaxID=148631 RepID=A0ABP0ELS6_9ASCO